MTADEAREMAVGHWWEQASEALESARDDFDHERLHRAVSSLYYACFYAVTAWLLQQGRSYSRHTAVQTAVNRELVATGLLDADLGRLYNAVSEARGRGDYLALTEFDPEEVRGWTDGAARFVAALRELAGR